MVPPVAVIGDAFSAVVVAVADAAFIVTALASAPVGSGSVGGGEVRGVSRNAFGDSTPLFAH